MTLSTQPYRGARDLYPEDMRLRNYIFNTWKQVCLRYGFEEYDFPILEPLEIFAAKTGEEIVNQQLFSFEDRGGRKLAIRPELTPGTVRMLAQKYGEIDKPTKWFMIGNNWRYEKPQKGRGREFYQLEVNIFGIDNIIADFEIFSVIVDIMKKFGSNETQFKISYSDRRLVTALLQGTLQLNELQTNNIRKLMDKRKKKEKTKFLKELLDLGLDTNQSQTVENFMNSTLTNLSGIITSTILEQNKGYQEIQKLTQLLKKNNLSKYCQFDPSIIRGFDYSDGLVYEVFDLNTDNNRSMFGGERFDKLVNIFGDRYNLPATGFAMGDWTLQEFLKGWNLLPDIQTDIEVLITVFSPNLFNQAWNLANKLRAANINTFFYPDNSTKLDKQLKFADKKCIPYVIIIGEEESKTSQVIFKNMQTGEQKKLTEEQLISTLKQKNPSAINND